MRTLALLTALLLLAFQAQAETLQETADQVPAQDQLEVEDQDQDQPGDKDEDVDVSFTGEEHFARRAAGLRKIIYCSCRRGVCPFPSRTAGTCRLYGNIYTFCCQ